MTSKTLKQLFLCDGLPNVLYGKRHPSQTSFEECNPSWKRHFQIHKYPWLHGLKFIPSLRLNHKMHSHHFQCYWIIPVSLRNRKAQISSSTLPTFITTESSLPFHFAQHTYSRTHLSQFPVLSFLCSTTRNCYIILNVSFRYLWCTTSTKWLRTSGKSLSLQTVPQELIGICSYDNF